MTVTVDNQCLGIYQGAVSLTVYLVFNLPPAMVTNSLIKIEKCIVSTQATKKAGPDRSAPRDMSSGDGRLHE